MTASSARNATRPGSEVGRWNGNGKIGQAANYIPLVWHAKTKTYTGNAKIYPHQKTPHHYIRLEPGGGPPLKFSNWLGELKEGDTIYVAIGPDRTDGNDSFGLSFSIHK